MDKFNKFYVYERNRPVGIVENADQMHIDDITKLSTALKKCFDRDIHIRPIHPGDFNFDNLTGKKIDNITKFIYPEMEPE